MFLFNRRRRRPCALCADRDYDLARVEEMLRTLIARQPTAENLMRAIAEGRRHQSTETER